MSTPAALVWPTLLEPAILVIISLNIVELKSPDGRIGYCKAYGKLSK